MTHIRKELRLVFIGQRKFLCIAAEFILRFGQFAVLLIENGALLLKLADGTMTSVVYGDCFPA